MINDRRLKWVIVATGLLIAILLLKLLFNGPKVRNQDVDDGLAPRPDVIEWIEKYFGHDHRKKTALLRMAEADQYILTHPDADIEAERKDAQAMACYSVAFGDDSDLIDGMPAYEALNAQTYNTFARARKKIEFDGKMSGKMLKSIEIKSWEDQCEKPLWP